MEIYTEFEFNSKELDKVDNVLRELKHEGWVEYNFEDFYRIKPKTGRTLVSVKYWLKRTI